MLLYKTLQNDYLNVPGNDMKKKSKNIEISVKITVKALNIAKKCKTIHNNYTIIQGEKSIYKQ